MRLNLLFFISMILGPLTSMSPDSLKFPALAHAETRVGVILPLSGPSAILGEDCQRGIESAEPSRGAIKLIYADSKGDGKGGVTEFQRLVRQERVDAVLTTRSNTVLPMNPLSKQLKIPLLASIAPSSFTNDNPFSFQFWPTTEQEGRYLAQRLKQDGVRRLAIITAEDDWLVQNSSELRKAFSSPQSGDINPRSLKLDQSYNIVMDELLPTSEQDLLPIMLRLKSAKPDAVYLNITISQLPNALRRLRELKLQTKIFSNFWVSKLDPSEIAGGISEGVHFLEALYQFPGTENIFKAQFSDRPLSFIAVACYSSAAFLFDGIAKAHKSDHTITPESLFESLKTISSIQIGGAAIPVKDRKAQFSLGMFKIENGRKELLVEP